MKTGDSGWASDAAAVAPARALLVSLTVVLGLALSIGSQLSWPAAVPALLLASIAGLEALWSG